MRFIEQKLKGVFVIEPKPFEDSRGKFHRAFCNNEFLQNNIDFEIKQTNFSQNKKQYTLRGFHYRKPELPENKLLTCIRGSVYNVILDVRRDSETFLQWISLELNPHSGLSVFLPHGCANAFLTLEEDTCIHYYHSSIYKDGVDTGLRYNDPLLEDIEWPNSPSVISEKDLAYPDFQL